MVSGCFSEEKMMLNFISLNTVLNFNPPDAILQRYEVDYPNNCLTARQAFTELVKFLWLVVKHGQEKQLHDDKSLDFDFMLHVEMAEIDDMWHTFILFTREYTDFCNHYFGHYIHHVPTPITEKNKVMENYAIFLQEKVHPWLNYVYDNLGEETLKLWFKEYFHTV